MTEDEFVARVLAGQPEPPHYFAEMKRIDKAGPRLLGGARRPPHLPPEALGRLVDQDALVVDTRPAEAFAVAHVPGTINIPLYRSFTTWAGWLVPYDRDVYLLVEDGSQLDETMKALALIGLDRVAGYVRPEELGTRTLAGRALTMTRQMTVEALAGALANGKVNVLDVRGASEWASGHLPGARHIPLGDLEARLGELPVGRPLVVHCQGGACSRPTA